MLSKRSFCWSALKDEVPPLYIILDIQHHLHACYGLTCLEKGNVAWSQFTYYKQHRLDLSQMNCEFSWIPVHGVPFMDLYCGICGQRASALVFWPATIPGGVLVGLLRKQTSLHVYLPTGSKSKLPRIVGGQENGAGGKAEAPSKIQSELGTACKKLRTPTASTLHRT